MKWLRILFLISSYSEMSDVFRTFDIHQNLSQLQYFVWVAWVRVFAL